MPKLSIIIPVYNEEQTIGQVIERALAVVLPADVVREIMVINDGSTDRTKQILESCQNPSIRIFHQENQGKTTAVLTGIAQASGDIILIQDADLEYAPEQYPLLIAPILEKQADVVYGSRFLGSIKKMHVINRMANISANTALRLCYGVKMTDINTCFKVFRKEVLEGLRIDAKNFSFDIEVTVKLVKRKVKILEVPIDYTARTDQEGKKINWVLALETFWPMIKHRFRD